MSSSPKAVVVRDLGKKYKIYNSPFQRIKEGLHFGRKDFHRPVWALRGVNIEMDPGHSLGIIGSNGAGNPRHQSPY